MAGILTLTDDLSLDVLRAHMRFAMARLKSDPNAAQYVAGFTSFAAQWAAADQQEMALDDAMTDALAGAVTADAAIDALVDTVNVTINGAKRSSGKNPQQQLYFGSKAPAKFKQPILGSELQDVEPWPSLFAQSTVPELKALVPQGTTAVQNGLAAAKGVSDAITARDAWRQGGPRKALFDAFNALCTTTHAGLKAFALANPHLRLGSGYADSFFKHSASSPYGKTVNEAASALASAQKKAAAVQKHHDALAAKAAAKAAAAAEREKAKAALETAKAATRAAKKAEKAAAEAARKKVRK